jgi:putative DNA primase/helicase
MSDPINPSATMLNFVEGAKKKAEKKKAAAAGLISHDELALGFAAENADVVRFVAKQSRWLIYDGARWLPDEKRLIFTLVRRYCRAVSAAATDPREAKQIRDKATIAAVESLAQSDERLASGVKDWDVDLWLFNTPGGTVDLKTGLLRKHSSADHITKIAAVTPGGECPLWLKFLERVTGGDSDFQEYLQRIFGYALTGSTTEQALFFLFGTGANGKGVTMQTISRIFKDYHCTAPISTFTVSFGDRHPTELADLCGARLVTVGETEEGRGWSEKLIKQLTGGDPMKGRFMRQDLFEFDPQLKLVISGNQKPTIKTVDIAIRRRMNLLPFTITIEDAERDPLLTEKLKGEWPGLLQWMIEGCLKWQAGGLKAPKCVLDATEEYLANEDAFATWIMEKCETKPGYKDASGKLFASWSQWCSDAGEEAGTSKSFKNKLEGKTYRNTRSNAGSIFHGIRLKSEYDSGS